MEDIQHRRAGKSLVELLRDNDIGCCEECLCDRAADEIERLRAALKFYANATEEDWHNDNGFNANAALA